MVVFRKHSTSCMISGMATKTISLETEACERLRRAKHEGEPFSAVVEKPPQKQLTRKPRSL